MMDSEFIDKISFRQVNTADVDLLSQVKTTASADFTLDPVALNSITAMGMAGTRKTPQAMANHNAKEVAANILVNSCQ